MEEYDTGRLIIGAVILLIVIAALAVASYYLFAWMFSPAIAFWLAVFIFWDDLCYVVTHWMDKPLTKYATFIPGAGVVVLLIYIWRGKKIRDVR